MNTTDELLLRLQELSPEIQANPVFTEISSNIASPDLTEHDLCLLLFKHLQQLMNLNLQLTCRLEEQTAANEKNVSLNRSLTIMNEQLEDLVAAKNADALSDTRKLSEQYEELKQTERKIRRNAEIHSVLREIAEATVLTPSMDELYVLIHRVIERVLPARLFHINLLDEANSEIVVPFRSDYINFIPARRPVDKGMTEYIMRLGRTVHVTPAEMDRLCEIGEYTLGKTQNVQVRHYLGAPLINPQGKPFGVMSLIMMGESHSFQTEDVEAFSIIASQVSMAIERKRMEEERQNLEKHLLHAQKMESLGVLAGGIAHDFNNILLAIMGNADLALMKTEKNSPVAENLRSIERASQRAAKLAGQMLAYSGRGHFIKSNIDLNTHLNETLNLLEVSVIKGIEIELHLADNLPAIEVDVAQLQQIIMNLVINASEAIGENGGIISIKTGSMNCDVKFFNNFWRDVNMSDGTYLFLEITDNGCGMDEAIQEKLFDPFFTTKFTGRGLGMAAVHGIVRGHSGAIRVVSEPGQGSAFTLFIPVSGKPLKVINSDPPINDWKGKGTVLLVDDEEVVRNIGREMLQELGFTVITANNGREAITAFQGNFDVSFVILDLTMPHVDGEECFRKLKQYRPDVKVIISSGYSVQEVTRKFIGKGVAGFIQKPYNLSALQEAIRMIT